MLQVIITATLLITGLLAKENHVNQTSSSQLEICLETSGELIKPVLHSKENSHLLEKRMNLKHENERETI
jgi:hypothetical protein